MKDEGGGKSGWAMAQSEGFFRFHPSFFLPPPSSTFHLPPSLHSPAAAEPRCLPAMSSRLKKNLLFGVLLIVLLFVVPLVLCGWLVHHAAKGRIYADDALLPFNKVGLVLGTSPTNDYNGLPNLHFMHRLQAAAALYHARRVRHLLLTGNNDQHGYDEPAEMRAVLLKLGVPEGATTLDPAGFRTLDSVVRARDVYGQHRLTVITDHFHSYRTVFLARHYGIDAVAFPSEEVELRWSFRSRVRECFADVKACLDLYVFHTKARELGNLVVLPVPGG